MAKEIKEAINVKAGVTDADISEFFDRSDQLEDELDDGEVEEAHAGTTGETAVPETINTSVSSRRSSNVSAISAMNQSITAAASLNNKKTRGNIITSAIQQATEQTKSSLSNSFCQNRWLRSLSGNRGESSGRCLSSSVGRSARKIGRGVPRSFMR
jgi:hypothetical protein